MSLLTPSNDSNSKLRLYSIVDNEWHYVCPLEYFTIKSTDVPNEGCYDNYSSRMVLASFLDDMKYYSESQKIPTWLKQKMSQIEYHLLKPEKTYK